MLNQENNTAINYKRDSVYQLAKKHNIKISCQPTDTNPNFMGDSEWMQRAHHWKVTLKKNRKQMTVYFSMGMLRYEEPKIEEVLDCLKMDFFSIKNERTFEEWASSLGYETDSLRAYKSWLVSKRQAKRFEKFMGKGILEELEQCESL